MNAQSTVSSPKIKRESKNKIRVDFERTSFWTRFRLKFLTGNAFGKAMWWLFRFILLLGISYVILQPLYSKVASSFMSKEDFVDVTVKLIPKRPTLDTYRAIIVDNGYLTSLLNTTILSVTCGLIQTFVCSIIGYGFAKYKFKGAKLMFALVLLTMIVPHQTLYLSMFNHFRFFDFGMGGFGLLGLLGQVIPGVKTLNLINSYTPLYMLSLTGLAFKNGLYIFMMRQFFRGVPDELEESAYIDGYGPFKTFFKIIIPLSVPMMITIFLFSFSWQWTDSFYSGMFFPTTGPKLFKDILTVPSSLKDEIVYSGQMLYEAAINNTCAMLILAPLIVVYLFCQRYLVEGIERSGIVG